MAEIFNPWQQPPSDSTLSHTFVIEEYEDSTHETEMAGDMMAKAVQVIDQQSQLIRKLLDTLASKGE